MIKVPDNWMTYTDEPEDALAYTQKMDRMYSAVVKAYDGFMKAFPLWKKWLSSVLPHVKGNRVLEVSFGPAYLLGELPEDMKVYGLDFNEIMVRRAKMKIRQKGKKAKLIQGNVEAMPYPDGIFDTVINTMAFSGYPDGKKAMSEMVRVLKTDGVLLLLDYDYPAERNFRGFLSVKFIELCGDIIRDVEALAIDEGCLVERTEIGCFGAVQLFRITKNKV